MTNKELLYIEDALGHVEHISALCKSYSSKMTDENLRKYVNDLDQFACALKKKYISTLEGESYVR